MKKLSALFLLITLAPFALAMEAPTSFPTDNAKYTFVYGGNHSDIPNNSAMALVSDNPEYLKKLLSRGQDVLKREYALLLSCEGLTFFETAEKYQRMKVLKFILWQMPYLVIQQSDKAKDPLFPYKRFAMQWAYRNGWQAITNLLFVTRGREHVFVRGLYESAILHDAVNKRDIKFVERILNDFPKARHVTDVNGRTALNHAIFNRAFAPNDAEPSPESKIVKLFFRSGKETDMRELERELTFTRAPGKEFYIWTEKYRSLMQKFPHLATYLKEKKITPLHLAIAMGDPRAFFAGFSWSDYLVPSTVDLDTRIFKDLFVDSFHKFLGIYHRGYTAVDFARAHAESYKIMLSTLEKHRKSCCERHDKLSKNLDYFLHRNLPHVFTKSTDIIAVDTNSPPTSPITLAWPALPPPSFRPTPLEKIDVLGGERPIELNIFSMPVYLINGPGEERPSPALESDHTLKSPTALCPSLDNKTSTSANEMPQEKSVASSTTTTTTRSPIDLNISSTRATSEERRGVKRKLSSVVATPYIKNGLLNKLNRTMKAPEPCGQAAKKARVAENAIIGFNQIGNLAPAIGKPINSHAMRMREFGSQFEGEYFTLNNSLPSADERITIILAKRTTRAFIPSEQDGGRVVLIISHDEKAHLWSLVNDHIDVFVIKAMDFHQKALRPDELGLFTSRRLAAFMLGRWLNRKTIAVLDDNIQEIQVSSKLNIYDWPHIYDAIKNELMKNYTCIGFKEISHENPGLDPQSPAYRRLTVVNQGPNGNQYSFGQKIFFYQLERINFAELNGASNLLPPGIRLPQEDFFFQIMLAKSKHQVGHVSRDSMTFFRKRGKSQATAVASGSEQWLQIDLQNLDRYFALTRPMETILRETVEYIQGYVRTVLEKNCEARHLAVITPLSTVCERAQRQPSRSQYQDEEPEDEEEREPENPSGDSDPFVEEMLSELTKVFAQPDESSPAPRKKPRLTLSEKVAKYLSDVKFGALDLESDVTKLFPKTADESSQHHWLNFKNALLESFFYKSNQAATGLSYPSLVPSLNQLFPFQRRALFQLGKYFLKEQEPDKLRREDGLVLVNDQRARPSIGFYDMATGTGKTEVMLRIVQVAGETLKGNVAIVLPTLVLEDQTYRRVREFAESIRGNQRHLSNISAVSSQKNHASAKYAAVNIPLMQGGQLSIFCEKSFMKFIKKRRGQLKDFSMILFDEMHKVRPFTKEFIQRAKESPHGLILGFSATPNRNLELFGGENGRVYSYDTKTAVNEDRLAPWDTMVSNVEHLNDVEKFGPELVKLLKEVTHQGANLAQKQGIIYSNFSAEQLNTIASFLTKTGIPTEAYHYKTRSKAEVLKRFKQRETKVLLAIRTLREGFDASVDYVYIVNDGYSDDDLIQMRGRALRINYLGKRALIIVATEEQALKLSFDGNFEVLKKLDMVDEENLVPFNARVHDDTDIQQADF